jgi:hypothetical protein
MIDRTLQRRSGDVVCVSLRLIGSLYFSGASWSGRVDDRDIQPPGELINASEGPHEALLHIR